MKKNHGAIDGSRLVDQHSAHRQVAGTYAMYAASPSSASVLFGKLQLGFELDPWDYVELRAQRLRLQRQGKAPIYRRDHFYNEVLVVLGADLGPSEVIKALETVIANIQQSGGLYMGPSIGAAAYYEERFSGEVHKANPLSDCHGSLESSSTLG